MKVLDLVQNTEEWEIFRNSKIGSSDAPVIMGVSPWSTQYQLWAQKKGFEKKSDSFAMRRGREMECVAMERFEYITGIKMIPAVVQSEKNEWQIASLDGLSENGDAIVEIKVPSREVCEMARRKEIPHHYMAQIQHQLCVTGLPFAYYFVFDGLDGFLVEVPKNASNEDDMCKKEMEFYDLLLKNEAPDLEERDFVDRLDAQWKERADRYIQLHSEIKKLEEDLNQEKKKIIELSCGKNTKGWGICFSQSFRKGVVDACRLSKELGVDLDAFRKNGSIVSTIRIAKNS